MSRLNRFLNDAKRMIDMENAYDMRRRLNPHHSEDDVRYERERKNHIQTKLFFALKQEFILFRDELYQQAEGFKEGTQMLNQFDKIIDNEVNEVILGGSGDEGV